MKEIIWVFYKDSNGYHPALVTKVFGKEEDENPDVALCVFVAGYHSPTFGVPRVKHGEGANQYLLQGELPEEKVEVKKPETPVVNVDLTKPLVKPAETKKAAKEPKAPKEPKAKAPEVVSPPDAEQGKQQQDEATGEGNSEPSA